MAPPAPPGAPGGAAVGPGLTLFEGAVPPALQEAAEAFVEAELARGRAGELPRLAFSAPACKFAARGQSREMLHYGAYTNSNRLQAATAGGSPEVPPVPPPLEAVCDALVALGVFREGERPDSCTVNAYREGEWLPPHIDSPAFSRPFCTVSLGSEQHVVFGQSCRVLGPGVFEGDLDLPLPVGSALRLDGPGANLLQHAVPAHTARRISLTFRRVSAATGASLRAEMSKGQQRKAEKRERKRALKLAKRLEKMREKSVHRAGAGEGGAEAAGGGGEAKSTPVPLELRPPEGGGSNGSGPGPSGLPELEREHVQKLYDTVAEQWHGTRYRPWPRVARFIAEQPEGSLIGDIGCGNGKNMPACGDRGFVLGCDFSIRLVGICRERGEEALAADNLHLPYRSGCFHAVLSIAVLHHISTEARRVRAIAETMRVVQLGGRGLFYAWAREQVDARSGHAFEGSDVFVPWHLRYRTDRRIALQKPEDVLEGATASHGVVDKAKGAVVFQRYCHVYEEGELQELFARLPWVEVTESYYDTGNWCVVAKKISEPL